ncbi:MAG: hypothetical protein JNL41_03205 [Phenylobacterium sp.]|uniref:hypothetical protein n=1 Tax=Phenylobacterium sp. TaxID=1871053 RepID=UPI001A489039|nr:hypothetical protein [Phenylobacterium sp.]MBL8553261.1 hypothetical protein [Phenylobacterium sp.]
MKRRRSRKQERLEELNRQKPTPWAKTLDELRLACEPDGEAVVHHLRCGEAAEFRRRAELPACEELSFYRDHVNRVLGHPRSDGRLWPDTYAKLDQEEQDRVRTVALAVLAEWEAAGAPIHYDSLRIAQQRWLATGRILAGEVTL